MNLTKKDVEKILKDYSLGNLISVQKIKRRCDHLQPSFIIKTTKEKFFLKIYWVFDYSKKKGLEFNLFLQKRNYPCNKVISTKDKKSFFKLGKFYGSIFEFMPYKEKLNLNLKECFEFGKGLAKLHVMSKNYKGLKETLSPEYFSSEFNKNLFLSKKAPKNVKDILEEIRKDYVLSIKKIKKLPKGICHTEFTPQHTRFSKNKLVSVIDWDLINKSYFIYDLGTALSTSLNKSKINFKKAREILKGYESVRKLTKQEKDSLYEATKLGLYKFITWGLDKEEIEKSGWENIGIPQAKILLKLGKEKFNERLL